MSRATLDGDPRRTVEQAMEPGPSTVRPDTAPGELARRRDLRTALVTTPDGVHIAIVRLEDLEQAR